MAQYSSMGLPLSDSATALQTANLALLAGESQPLDRMMTVAKATASSNVTSDTLINTGPAVILGYVVHVATATNIIEIRDSTTAGGGTTRVTIPASTAVGVYHFGGVGISCTTGIYLDFTGTGTVSVLYAGES